MRLWALAFCFGFVLACSVQGFSQPSAGPAKVEGLPNAGEHQEPADADAAPKPPAGTVTRPKDGVPHPDLDEAWADYDAAVAKVTESIQVVITKQFDAAAAKGDLNTAEKWQAIGEKFEKVGELPSETETKAAVNAAAAD